MSETLEGRSFRWLFDAAVDPMLVVDRDGLVVLANPAAQALFGYALAELAGQPVENLMPERFRARHRAHHGEYASRPWSRAVGGGLDLHALRRDGTEFAVDISLSPIEQGLVLATVHDISARKQAEAKLAEARDLFRQIAEIGSDYFWELDEQFRFRAISPPIAERAGFDYDSHIGRTRWELPYLGADEAKWAEHRATLEAHLPFRQFELGLADRDGRQRWFLIGGDPIFGADGRFAGYRGVTQEITQRKRVEQELAEARDRLAADLLERTAADEALRAKEAQLRAFVEHAPVAIAMLDNDMRYLFASRRWLADYGLDGQDLTGRSHYEVFPEIPERWKEIHRRCLAGAVEHDEEDYFDRANGSTQCIRWEIRPWRSASDTIGGIVIFSEDITERKRAEAALQAMRAETERLMTLHVASQTVAAIAHELNQPLNAVTAYSEAALRLLRECDPTPERVIRALQGSADQAQRAGQVVRDLLKFLNKGEAERSPISLADAIRRALGAVESNGYGGFQAVVDLASDLAPVSANQIQVEKVVVNLLQNGVEAMRGAGMQAGTIVVLARADGPMAQVTVRDRGPGIDAQTLHRIFDPFFSTKRDGLGMGLSISRAIVEAHGGSLWVEPGLGTGASVHFTLPFA